MKRSHQVVAGIAAALSLAAAAAFAHPEGGMGPGFGPGAGAGMGPGMGPMGSMMGRHGMAGRMAGANPAAIIDSHLADLKAELKIGTAQEAAWQSFAGKARQQAETMQAMRGKMLDATGTAPERMAQRTEAMKQQIANMETMSAALKDLYAVLTPEQKAIADQHVGMMGGRRMAFARPGR